MASSQMLPIPALVIESAAPAVGDLIDFVNRSHDAQGRVSRARSRLETGRGSTDVVLGVDSRAQHVYNAAGRTTSPECR
jgi:hypothetical protein